MTTKKEKRIAGLKVTCERLRQNPEYKQAIRELQEKHRIYPAMDYQARVRKIDSLGEKLVKDVVSLRARFSLPDNLNILDDLFFDEQEVYMDPGLPQARGDSGKPMELIVTDSDVTDPKILKVIKQFRLYQLTRFDPPPQPQPMLTHPRKYDWMPVWIWNMAHTEISRKELAIMLGRSDAAVRWALHLIDRGNLPKDD